MEENARRDVYRAHGPNSRDNADKGQFRQVQSEVERFWSRVRFERGDGCWLWTGGVTIEGYGRFALTPEPRRQRLVRAHRYAYELLVGPIPEGLTLDHLCEIPPCVRPNHLEPVTNSENLRRRSARRRLRDGDGVTLWHASSDKGRGIVALKYEALAKAAQRDRRKGLFPKPIADHPLRLLYDPRDLQRWELLRGPSSNGATQ